MIRLICSETDAGMAANVGGPVTVNHKTFDVELPEVEVWLTAKLPYAERRFVGIEILFDEAVTKAQT